MGINNNKHYIGIFWIISDSITDINNSNYNLLILKENYNLYDIYNNNLFHRNEWKDSTTQWYYYPRGRVMICDNKAFIKIPYNIHNKELIDKLVCEFALETLEIIIEWDEYNIDYQYLIKE